MLFSCLVECFEKLIFQFKSVSRYCEGFKGRRDDEQHHLEYGR